jgi:hypothetical protein
MNRVCAPHRMPDSGRKPEPTDHTPRHEASQNSGQTQTTTTVRTLSVTELADEPGYYLIIAVKTIFTPHDQADLQAEPSFWHPTGSSGPAFGRSLPAGPACLLSDEAAEAGVPERVTGRDGKRATGRVERPPRCCHPRAPQAFSGRVAQAR